MEKMKKKVLITGAAGFIGSHLADRLAQLNYEVIGLDNLTTGKKENLNPQVKFHRADITHFEQIKKLFQGVDTIFHTAAMARIQPSIKDPRQTFEVNARGTLNVLLAARAAGVRRLVYSASSSVYGDQAKLPLTEKMIPQPKSMYALSKLMGEEMCRIFSQLYGLETISLRYFNVYGPRQITEGAYSTVVGIFLDQLAKGHPLTIVGNGLSRRDFTHITDVVEANVKAMKTKRAGRGEIFNIGYGHNYNINEVAAMILQIPLNQLGLAVKQGLVAYIPPRPAESKITLADNTRARREFGWQPKVSFKQGLKKLL